MGKFFCPRCGKEKEKLASGLCLTCLLEKGELFSVPEKIEVTKCPVCGKIKYHHSWVKPRHEFFEELLENASSFKKLPAHKVRLGKIEFGEKEGTAIVLVNGVLESEKVSVEKKLAIRLLRSTCPSCSRVAGSYFEAVIQGRFEKGTPKKTIQNGFDEVKSFLEKNSSKDSLSKIVKHSFSAHGFDLWVGSKKACVKAIRFFGPRLREKPKVSFKLHGWDLTKNRPQKRFTFLLRF